MATWELRDYDESFFEKELNSFVPDDIFDAHAHLYRASDWGLNHPTDSGPSIVTMEEFQRQIDWVTPGRHTSGLFFGVAFNETFRDANTFVANEVAKDPASLSQMLVSPYLDPEEMREMGRRLGFRGIKVYHSFLREKPTWNADIRQFLIEDHVRIAHEEGWSITLHIMKARALADPENQHAIVDYCTRYPNIRMILAHAGRGFNVHHTIEGIGTLRGLQNVWFDTSAVTETGAFEAIIETMGHERLMWGSDFPISHLRGRCVAVGDQFLWLYEDTLVWDKVLPHPVQPLLIGHESLRALKLAATRLKLTDSQIEDIFYRNAVSMFGLQ
jgi:predicted TIM-barrel fold metal-dependent hydrolase